MINEVDTNGDHTIDFNEFLSLMAHKMKDSDTEEDLKEIFKVFDRDGNNLISSEDFRNIMNNLGECLTVEETNEMFREVDDDNDGNITFEEFVRMMMTK